MSRSLGKAYPPLVPKEVFLSHSDQDRLFTADLADMMRRHGIPVWYSRTNIRGGQQWHDEIGTALQRCDWFVLILSPNAVGSMWVRRELLYALQQRRFDNKIIPILYQDCAYDELSWTLSQFQMIECGEDITEGYRKLLQVWGLGYTPP